jgi:hypothetical protein|tara:strand:+ start:224 stop:487 length:264 start_codon:yes stop_codon:yes gene_type:complete
MPIPKTASARSKQELIYTVWHLLASIDTLSFQIRNSTLGTGLEPWNPKNKDSPQNCQIPDSRELADMLIGNAAPPLLTAAAVGALLR